MDLGSIPRYVYAETEARSNNYRGLQMPQFNPPA